jgi:3-hydroxybutyrate dehydrogenase
MMHYLSSSFPASEDNPKTIVHISSIAGEMASTPTPLYAAAKWGLRGFIYTLGELEQSRHIRVAGVAPAVVRTPLWLEHKDKKAWVTSTDQVQDEWVYPEEVAEVVCMTDAV